MCRGLRLRREGRTTRYVLDRSLMADDAVGYYGTVWRTNTAGTSHRSRRVSIRRTDSILSWRCRLWCIGMTA